MLEEGNATYKQQCDVVFKPKHYLLLALSIILDGTTLLCQIREILKKDPLVIGI
jgi:hypothetical protein